MADHESNLLTKKITQHDRASIKSLFQQSGAAPFFSWLDAEVATLQERVWMVKSFEELKELKGTRETFIRLKSFILSCISET